MHYKIICITRLLQDYFKMIDDVQVNFLQTWNKKLQIGIKIIVKINQVKKTSGNLSPTLPPLLQIC